MNGLDFEKPILELEKKIEELRSFTAKEDMDLSGEIKKLEERLKKIKQEVFKRNSMRLSFVILCFT